MKLVMIEKIPDVNDLMLNKIPVRLDKTTTLKPGVNIVRKAMAIKPMHGSQLSLRFELDVDLAKFGVMLNGAYQESEEMVFLLYNLANLDLGLTAGTVVANAIPYEAMAIRQVEKMMADMQAIQVEPPKKAKGRKKKTS